MLVVSVNARMLSVLNSLSETPEKGGRNILADTKILNMYPNKYTRSTVGHTTGKSRYNEPSGSTQKILLFQGLLWEGPPNRV